MLPSWTWPLLQSASGPLNQLALTRLSWDSFSRAPPPTAPSRVHSRPSPCEDDPRQLASTRSACSDLVVSHHLAGLLRVTASDVLQSEPAGVRCVASNPALHPWQARPEERDVPFPQRGHPSKNLPRRQLETISRWPLTLLRLPPSQCRPESPTSLLGPLQGIAPSTLVDRLAPRCRFARQPAFSHGLLYLQRLETEALRPCRL
jgi:hypothetical protein